MSREFCLEQDTRIYKLERAVAELQLTQSKGLWMEKPKYPIHPPAEQDDEPDGDVICKKCEHNEDVSPCECEHHVNFKPKKDKCESCKKFDSNVAGCCLKCFGYSAYEPKACKAYEGSGEVIKSQAEVMIDYCFGVRNTESIKPCPGGKGTGIELEGEQK